METSHPAAHMQGEVVSREMRAFDSRSGSLGLLSV